MTNDDICGAEAKSTGEPCQRPAGWGTDSSSGRCKFHGGASTGAPEKNQNAQKHGLHSTPEYLLEDLDETHRDTYHATFESLCSRYERIHGYEPDFAAKKRLSRVSVEMVKEDLADEYLKQNHSDHILVEDEVVGYTEDGRPQEVTQTNKILPELTALKRETRLTLKDMGLLEDPESKKAEATQDLAEIWVSDLTE